jgi:hypothetical protein
MRRPGDSCTASARACNDASSSPAFDLQDAQHLAHARGARAGASRARLSPSKRRGSARPHFAEVRAHDRQRSASLEQLVALLGGEQPRLAAERAEQRAPTRLSGSRNTSSASVPAASMACGTSGAVSTPGARRALPDRSLIDSSPSSANTTCSAWCAWSVLLAPGPRVASSGGHKGRGPSARRWSRSDAHVRINAARSRPGSSGALRGWAA